ncbi:T-complex protein 1 subunit eta [Pichia californica]|uniref:T-complex protein 1 subunit eta n=1 Tax=Pichia californica TaxID=460514 RepID=A0A9P6WL55_9ASCO|nr:T-complex protein 1 subunit eta [[Candida] californica]KAG0689136.1 T-complex protein 1 subunit eta [[Candida] californica]
MSYRQTPTIVVLKEGTDTSQGRGQIVSNINACLAIQDTLKSTLGPFGSDILLVGSDGKTTITNDGATILKKLDVVHPAAKILVDISRSQDCEIGDGTTSVCLLASEILKNCKNFIEEGMSSNSIIKGLRDSCNLAIKKIKDLEINLEEKSQEDEYDMLIKCALTAMNSKIIQQNGEFYAKLVVDSVLTLDRDDLDENLIGIKKIAGGAMEDSLFINGVGFKKTFSYAGFEQQPKTFTNPKILSLNVELELKAEKDNAEVRIEKVNDYQKIVDAEWGIIMDKLNKIVDSKCNIVLSKLPIGDLATQFFADRGIFCAGRVANDDLDRIIKAVGGSILTSVNEINIEKDLGTCDKFEELQIGSERFNIFNGCPKSKTCTLILRGGSIKIIDEIERSLHDAIMIVKRALKNKQIVAGGGAIEMELSKYLRDYSHQIKGKKQLIIQSFAKSLEIIPRQLCENAGLDSIELLNKLRNFHANGEIFYGLDLDSDNVANNLEKFVWEPSVVKINALESATEAAILVLSVDETIQNKENDQGGAPGGAVPRGRGMPMPMGM